MLFTSRNGIDGIIPHLLGEDPTGSDDGKDDPLSAVIKKSKIRLAAIGKDAELLAKYGLEVKPIPIDFNSPFLFSVSILFFFSCNL